MHCVYIFLVHLQDHKTIVSGLNNSVLKGQQEWPLDPSLQHFFDRIEFYLWLGQNHTPIFYEFLLN